MTNLWQLTFNNNDAKSAVHLTVDRTEWNEKTNDVVAGLDGPSGLSVHGCMDGC